uniref:Pleckstrin homology domain containing B1 n=1 Tax=Anas platyrhynchos platyrhynchos TaxID=8840 RepID=A0A493T1W7_ANAPP
MGWGCWDGVQGDKSAGDGVKRGWDPARSLLGSILRRWKRNWFVLYLDGSLLYYHDQTQRDMDGRLHIKHSCRDVRIGPECRGEQQPPAPKPSVPKTFSTRGKKKPFTSRGAGLVSPPPQPLFQVHVYDPYDDDYYQAVPIDSHQAAYVSSGHYGHQYGAPGVTHVIVREDPYRVSGDQMALGLLAGAATGAALGSFMWMPCWF